MKYIVDAERSEKMVNLPVIAADQLHARPGILSRRLLGILAAAFLTASCLPPSTPTLPKRDGLSEVQVYLQPVPSEAWRLVWTLGDLSVVRNDGTRVPLNLRLDHYKGSDLEGRQTRLASGFVPPGSYSGVSLTFTGAALKGEDGDAALLVPEDPLVIETPFDTAPSEVLPLFISISPAGLVNDGFAFSPDFSLALPSRELASLTGYLTIPESDQITVFNRKTLQVIGAVATGRNPGAIAIDSSRGRAYVAVTDDDYVEVIDVFGNDVRERIILRSRDEPVDLALSGDGQVLVTANYTSGTISIIDPVQGVETDRVEVGRGPTSVAVNRNGTRAYVTCSLSGTLSVVDLSTGTLSTSLSMEETEPLDAAFGGDEENLFVIGGNSPHLMVIDAVTLKAAERIYVGTGSVSLAVDELSGLVFVSRRSNSEIAVCDPSVLLPVDYIGLGGFPGNMTVDLQEKALLVVLPGKKILQKVDLVNRKVLAEMKLDGTPRQVAVID